MRARSGAMGGSFTPPVLYVISTSRRSREAWITATAASEEIARVLACSCRSAISLSMSVARMRKDAAQGRAPGFPHAATYPSHSGPREGRFEGPIVREIVGLPC